MLLLPLGSCCCDVADSALLAGGDGTLPAACTPGEAAGAAGGTPEAWREFTLHLDKRQPVCVCMCVC
jgi:hypothetical protein